MLTQQEALELFNYDPETGIVTRKATVGNQIKGNVAGTLCSSGYIMVRVDHKRKSWRAWINNGKERKYLYDGNDFFEACCRRKSAENRLGYHLNHGDA